MMETHDPTHYKKLSQRDHMREKPGMYVGSISSVPRSDYIFDAKEAKFSYSSFSVSPAIERTFLEIISNAADASYTARQNGRKIYPINVEMTDTSIRVTNKGCIGIPLGIHPEHGIHVPELIFGNLLTSSNYGPADETKKNAGTYGIGAKATNVYSSKFQVMIGNKEERKTYHQEWEEGMSVCKPPVLTDHYNGPNYVSIEYDLDFPFFKTTQYDEEACCLFFRRTLDYALTCKVPVTFNDEAHEYSFSDIKDYAKVIFGTDRKMISFCFDENGEITKNHRDPTVELCIIDTEEGNSISFVNGMTTVDGVHLQQAYSAISAILLPLVNSPKKESSGVKLMMSDVKNYLSVIISFRTANPEFVGQTKERLSGPKPKMKLTEADLKPILSWDILSRLRAAMEAKEFLLLKKTDGGKKRMNLENGVNANWIYKSPQDCTLFLIEGKSAKNYSVASLNYWEGGRNVVGILPLKGKPLNAMNASFKQLSENKEFNELKQMLGLREMIDYSNDKNFASLNYGSVLILADSDTDGCHIASLILNYFFSRCRGLLQRGCIMFLRTPIIRVYVRGKKTKSSPGSCQNDESSCISFYKLSDFKDWTVTHPDYNEKSKYRIHYQKGLGTSRPDHVKEDWETPKIVQCIYDDSTEETMKLAFDQKNADLRKKWMSDYKEGLKIDMLEEIPISQFIRTELIHYSLDTLRRAIPGVDGFKESIRKIIRASMVHPKWKGTSETYKSKLEEVKLAQFSAFVAGSTNYHHGEEILSSAISGLCQAFVGSNNLPLFDAGGMYGTRVEGGKDRASPRYLFTRPLPYLKYIFRKEDEDILIRKEEEGEEIEPEFYLPVIPLHIINGVSGIAVGYSTFIPNHSAHDVINWLLTRLKGNTPVPLLPWYRGFNGKIEIVTVQEEETPIQVGEEGGVAPEDEHEEDKFDIKLPGTGYRTMLTHGKFKEGKKSNEYIIDELPIGRWTGSYDKFLRQIFKKVENCSTDSDVNFTVSGTDKEEITEKELRLTRSYGLGNMVLLDVHGVPRNYGGGVQQIMESFYQFRLPFYDKRRDSILTKWRDEMKRLTNKMKFIRLVVDRELIIDRRPKSEVVEEMEKKHKLPSELLNIPIVSCTEDEIEKLKKEISGIDSDIDLLKIKLASQLWEEDLLKLRDEIPKVC